MKSASFHNNKTHIHRKNINNSNLRLYIKYCDIDFEKKNKKKTHKIILINALLTNFFVFFFSSKFILD